MNNAIDFSTILPVGVGGDVGVYAMLRAFHEQYGVRSIVLSAVATRAMADSSIVQSVVTPGIDDPEVMVAALEQIARSHPEKILILLTNADWFVEAIIDNSDKLEKFYIIPYCNRDSFDAVSSKVNFAEVCERLDIPTPRTMTLNIPSLVAQGDALNVSEIDFSFNFPVVAKPSNSADYHFVSFPGKRKIHHIVSRVELDELITHLVQAEYQGDFLIQEFIPGDETQMRSLTAYRDSRGDITMLSTGRVLLEEHTPGTLGIPAAILTEPYDDAMDAAARFLNEVDYFGFANFDYKLDPRTGRHVYFEVNPRIGRNNYYVTAAGVNIAKIIVQDLVQDLRAEPVRTTREVLYSVVPYGLLSRYIRDEDLALRLKGAKRRGDIVHPLKYERDSSMKRRFIVEAMTQNYRRKYARYYPQPTETTA